MSILGSAGFQSQFRHKSDFTNLTKLKCPSYFTYINCIVFTSAQDPVLLDHDLLDHFSSLDPNLLDPNLLYHFSSLDPDPIGKYQLKHRTQTQIKKMNNLEII